MMSDDLTQRFIEKEVNKQYQRILNFAKRTGDYKRTRNAIWSSEAYLYGIGTALVEVGCLSYNEEDYAVNELRKLLKWDSILLEYEVLNELIHVK